MVTPDMRPDIRAQPIIKGGAVRPIVDAGSPAPQSPDSRRRYFRPASATRNSIRRFPAHGLEARHLECLHHSASILASKCGWRRSAPSDTPVAESRRNPSHRLCGGNSRKAADGWRSLARYAGSMPARQCRRFSAQRCAERALHQPSGAEGRDGSAAHAMKSSSCRCDRLIANHDRTLRWPSNVCCSIKHWRVMA